MAKIKLICTVSEKVESFDEQTGKTLYRAKLTGKRPVNTVSPGVNSSYFADESQAPFLELPKLNKATFDSLVGKNVTITIDDVPEDIGGSISSA